MFDQFKGSIGSPETEASLKSATQIMTLIFANEQIAPALIGKTSFPLYLEGKNC
ncbi:MAG: hypothetical protein HC852_24735 [Acaryochloridaceae cyanobacterium RU_4_10]|nr:hypothetical protein [Acaryochloridaceae cyanobacterium RU_4_10]